MADISSITLPNGTTYNIKDATARKGQSVYYATCSTAAGTAAKAATTTNGDFTLETGAMVRVKFTNADTYNGTSTLNVDSKGAKNIVRVGTTIKPRYNWTAGEVVDFVYDGTYFVMSDAGTATTSYYGITALSSATNSTSEVLAATPKAVKEAYDLAASKGTGTVTKVSTGAGLTGGDITSSGTIKADLKSETKSSLTAVTKGTTANREYAVGLDANGDLSVNVPWENTQTVTGVKGSSESSYRTGDVSISASNIGLGNVENKSSATIRGELTSQNVIDALGYTPGSSGGTVTKVTAGTGLSGGDITTEGTIALKGQNIYYATCPTAAATAAKVATTANGDFELTTGAMVRVKFTNADTYNGTSTLNVDSKGAKNIVYIGTTVKPRYHWLAGEVVDFVYDGTYFVMSNSGVASTTYYGVTKLSSATDSTSTALAATPSAVKAAYDLAASKTDNTGTVTSVATGTGLTGGPITTTGTISLEGGVVTAGSAGPTAAVTGNEGNTVAIPRITVDEYGRVTGLTSYNLTNKNTTYTAATSAPGNVASSSAVGTSTNYARQDHTHGISLATGDSNGQIKIAGTNVDVKGWNTAATYDVESTVADDSKLPTGSAVKSFVESKGYITADNDTYTSAYCSTAADTAAKTATCTGFVLKQNEYLHITFTNSNTAASALTLNVNSTGAKPIYINAEASSSSNYTLPAGTYLIFYNGENWRLRTDKILPAYINKDNVEGLSTALGNISLNKICAGNSSVIFTLSNYNTTAFIACARNASNYTFSIFSNGYLINVTSDASVSVTLSSDYKTITVTNNSSVRLIVGFIQAGSLTVS